MLDDVGRFFLGGILQTPEEEETLPPNLMLCHLQWKMLHKRKVLRGLAPREIIVNKTTGNVVPLFGADQTVKIWNRAGRCSL
jgi:hypothetical protein